MDFVSATTTVEYSNRTGRCVVTPYGFYNEFRVTFANHVTVTHDKELLSKLLHTSEGGSWRPAIEGYRFDYSPQDILKALDRHRYFLSWYNYRQSQAFVCLQPSEIPAKWEQRLDHKPAISIKREIAGQRTKTKQTVGNPIRTIDLHCYPNYPFQIRDRESWDGSVDKKGRPFIKNKYVDSVFASEHISRVKEAANQVARFKDEYVTTYTYNSHGGILSYQQKHWYCVIDIDGTDIIPEIIATRALELGAVAYANTSMGCHHILFKSLRVMEDPDNPSMNGVRPDHSFAEPTMRALIAFHLLGISSTERFPDIDLLKEKRLPPEVREFLTKRGIDRNYLIMADCNDMLFRVIGSWNYKKSVRVSGSYFNKPKCYDDAAFIALAKKSVKSYKEVLAVADEEDSEGFKEFEDTLKPAFKNKEYRDQWARKLWDIRSHLSAEEPEHGLGVEALAERFGRTYQQIQVTLRKLVEQGYLIRKEEWQHPMRGRGDIRGVRETKKYAFGEKLAAFRIVEKEIYPINDIPYQRHHSRDGIIRDTLRLRRLGSDVDDIITFIESKYQKYVGECKPPEIRNRKDIERLVRAVY